MNIALQITANLSTLVAPFLPNTAAKLVQFLNIESIPWPEIGTSDLLKPGHTINKAGLLFEKIEDDVIEKQLDKLKKTKESNTQNSIEMIPQKEAITYDDFAKLDIRIGTILEAEKVPKTDKLMKLTIDTGIDKRTVVSGIAEFFEADSIIGKQVAVLINLEPRKLRGIESQGMILMAEDQDGSLKFISTKDKAEPGSTVS
jgi:methionyl-tRNA synthetase